MLQTELTVISLFNMDWTWNWHIMFWNDSNPFIWLLGHKKEKEKEKNTLFTSGRTCQVGSVSQAFFFSGSKNDPKNTKISKKNPTFLAEKFWENILTYFQNFSAKIFRFWSKKGWFYKILEKFLKKICQNGKFGSVVPVKRFFFFFFMALWLLFLFHFTLAVWH